LGAAVRLGLLGSLQAQKLHRKYRRIGVEYLALHHGWDYQLAVRTAPMIDLAQASHAHLYSKLFQS
jgi:urease accessory protein UreF